MNITWIKAAGIRSIKTMAQTAVGMVTVGAAINEIDWLFIASVSVVAGILSLLTSIAGLPEINNPATDEELSNGEADEQ